MSTMSLIFGCAVAAENEEEKMNGVINLTYQNQRIRVIRTDTSVYWVVRDVANVLGFSEPHNASRKIPTHTLKIPTNGGLQPVTAVDKDGLWKILYRGKRPGLKEFREWVAYEAMETLTGETDGCEAIS